MLHEQQAEAQTVEYTASPTCAQFHSSTAEVRGIRGPMGSGKTTACCFEIYIKAHQATPCKDNVRRVRAVCIRNTYSELKSTTIKTWEHWFGPRTGLPPVVYDVPIRWRKHWKYRGEPDVELEVLFLALDRPEHVKKLKSLEATLFFINEASEIPKEIFDMITIRHGRYPSSDDRPPNTDQWPSFHGVIMDTNSMDDDHWWYYFDRTDRPTGYEFFNQPGGFEPDAENLDNLPGGREYYVKAARGKAKDWIAVYINNEYGATMDGRPVYPEFNSDLHVSHISLEIHRGLPLYLGWDFGLTPACTASQVTPSGQWRILREWSVVGTTMGVKRFAQNQVIQGLNQEMPGMRLISYGDPGGKSRSQYDEQEAIKGLTKLGIPTIAAWTNAFKVRRDAVGEYMSRLVGNGEPGFIVDPSCTRLIKACKGAYKFRRIQVPGAEEKYTDVPDKNIYSHVGETIQYVAVEINRKRERPPPPRVGSYRPADPGMF